MKTMQIRYNNQRLLVIVENDDPIEDLKLYINNLDGTMRVMYRNEKGNLARLDKLLRGFSCVHKDGNNLDFRVENVTPYDRSAAYRQRDVTWGETGHKGIIKNARGKFVATFCVGGRSRFIKACDTIEEAVKVRADRLKQEGLA